MPTYWKSSLSARSTSDDLEIVPRRTETPPRPCLGRRAKPCWSCSHGPGDGIHIWSGGFWEFRWTIGPWSSPDYLAVFISCNRQPIGVLNTAHLFVIQTSNFQVIWVDLLGSCSIWNSYSWNQREKSSCRHGLRVAPISKSVLFDLRGIFVWS